MFKINIEKSHSKDFGTVYLLFLINKIKGQESLVYSSPDYDAVKDLQKKLQDTFRSV